MADKKKPGILDKALTLAVSALIVTGAGTSFVGVSALVKMVF